MEESRLLAGAAGTKGVAECPSLCLCPGKCSLIPQGAEMRLPHPHHPTQTMHGDLVIPPEDKIAQED